MKITTGTNIWELICNTPDEVAIMTLSSNLMDKINDTLKSLQWSTKNKAKKLNITLSRLEDLQKGKIDKFHLEELVALSSKLGIRIKVK